MALAIGRTGSATRRVLVLSVLSFLISASAGALIAGGAVRGALTLTSNAWGTSVSALIGCAVVIWAVARELHPPLWIFYRKRQVPAHWRQLSQLTYAALYGSLLGTGFATPFYSASHVAALIAASFISSR